MKILLAALNSKYIHTSPAVDSLKAFVSSGNIQAGSLSFTINQPEDQILGMLYEAASDVCCFSVYIWNCAYVYRLSRELKKVRPETEIWYGGPEVSFRSRELLKLHPEISGIMRGEGEETFQELTETWNFTNAAGKGSDREEKLSKIRGITWRDQKGEIHENPDREPIDPDRLVFPYEHAEPDRNRIYYYESSRGCPFGCTYCLSSIDKSLRFKSVQNVFRELDWFLENRVRQVKFVDRTFNLNGFSQTEKEQIRSKVEEPRYRKIWRYLKTHDNGFTNFHFEICGDLLEEEDLAVLKTLRPGQVQFEIGVQTVNPDTLSAIRRFRDEKKLKENTAALLENHNIHIHLDLIAGLPYENFESFRHSFDEVFRMEPLQLQLGFLKVLKGTPMESLAAEYSLEYRSNPPYEILSNSWVSFGEILKLKEVEEMVEVYYNSHQFEGTLTKLLSLYDSPFRMFLELAEYYKKTGNDRLDHARMKRYEILFEFIREVCSSQQTDPEEYIPLLLEDAAARERFRHWPEWAGNHRKPEGFDYDRRDPLTGNALRLF